VIRPLAYVRETDLANYATLRNFPVIPCDLCGSQENLKRQEVKALIKDWENRYPGSGDSIFTALTNVRPSQLLDRNLFDFSSFGRPV
jgi:tRNA 2-thiocytidine biosynthesis protein TtcA